MTKSRAERRHHHQRMLNKVKGYSYYQFEWHDETWKELHQKKTAENRKPCSCYSCCNRRRNPYAKGDKLSMQERRMNEYENE